jgi:hypothetical protein
MASLLATLPAGCVERKITIASDPPGALVYVNDVEMGRTPVTFPFLWYGDYDVRLRAQKEIDGQQREYYLHTHRKTEVPPFQWLGVDLFAELIPARFVDHKIWAFDVPEAPQPTQADLVDRAAALRNQLETPPEISRPREEPAKPQPKR